MGGLAEGVDVRVVLVRHGEPEAKAKGRCYGKLDVTLSAQGRAQVKAVVAQVRQQGIAAIVASPRVRAVQSAQILGDSLGLPVEQDPRVAELDFGQFEGLTYDEVAQRWPDRYAQWMKHPTEVQFPGGESFAVMKSRVLTCEADLRERHRGRAVAIVAHGGVGRIVLAHALGMADRNIFRLGQGYAGVSVIDWYGETPSVVMMNWQPTHF